MSNSGFLGNGIGPSPFGGSGELPAPVPVAGAELLTNGGFDSNTAWAKGSGWTIQDGTAVHDTTVGGYITQNVLTSGLWTQIGVNLIATSSLSNTVARAGSVYPLLKNLGANLITERATGTTAGFGTGTSTTITIDNASFKPLTLSSLLSARPYASANCDLSAAITRAAGTQAGFVARLDSASSPANFLIAYLDGAGNVKIDKCVGGTYTNIISGAVTYGSAKFLRLVCSGNDVSAYYDGTQVGSTVTVSDAGIVSNVRHGLFSTYASNSFAGYVAA